MKVRIHATIVVSLFSVAALTVASQVTHAMQPSAPAPAESMAADPGWPRVFEKDGTRVILHQPQIDEWTNFSTVKLRAAVQVIETPEAEGVFGVIEMTAKTRIDKEERLVLLTEPQTQIRFSEATAEEAQRLEAILRGLMQGRSSLEISLDRVLAHFDELHLEQQRDGASMEPPPIYYSSTPAALLIFVGEPRFKPIEDTSLMFAINTNWDVILDSATSTYFVRNESTWLSTKDIIKGPYESVRDLPKEFSKIPSNDNWADVRAAMPPKPSPVIPQLFVSTAPAELIVTTGEPEFAPITGTPLMYVANTDTPIILDPSSRTNYLLVAGRWFNAKDLNGPWKATTNNLPAAFASIPEDSSIAFVRASIPGTDESHEAVLLAAVPDKATINRKEAIVNVVYSGEPKFKPIESTPIKQATNTTFDVFSVDGKYYCCYEGVWFTSRAATGPWEVATSVPEVIYTIPMSHPAHNVTYVHVYESTPETVTVGSTSGYKGEYIVGDLLVFGAGILIGAAIADDDDDYWYAYRYPPYLYSYGGGVIYNGAAGGYYRAARAYGPYGGAGAGAIYNPSTGGWARGAYAYGPSGAAFARGGYNPWTNTSFAQAGRATPYGSWSRGVAVRDDEWVRGGTASGARGSAGWIETSQGSGAVHLDPSRGGQSTIAKDQQGNVYVGKDGNIYRRDEEGTWNQRQNGNWEGTQQQPRPTRTPQPSTAPQDRTATHQELDRQQKARETGNARTNNHTRNRSQPAGRSGGGRRGHR